MDETIFKDITHAAHLSDFVMHTSKGPTAFHRRPPEKTTEKTKDESMGAERIKKVKRYTFSEEPYPAKSSEDRVSLNLDRACIDNSNLRIVLSSYLNDLVTKGFLSGIDIKERIITDDQGKPAKKWPLITLALMKSVKNTYYKIISERLNLRLRQVAGPFGDLFGILGEEDGVLSDSARDIFLANVDTWYREAVIQCWTTRYGEGAPGAGPWWHIDDDFLVKYPNLKKYQAYYQAQKAL